jgi:hypothetical protein
VQAAPERLRRRPQLIGPSGQDGRRLLTLDGRAGLR